MHIKLSYTYETKVYLANNILSFSKRNLTKRLILVCVGYEDLLKESIQIMFERPQMYRVYWSLKAVERLPLRRRWWHCKALSHCHTGSYDCLIVRSVAMWRTCDRSAMFATIASSDRILRSVFLPGGRSPYDWSYAWSRDQHRLEKIVRLVVVVNDRSYDRSWPPTIDCMINSVGR